MALTLGVCESTNQNINTINLSKVEAGSTINLSKENPSLTKLVLKLVWEGNIDLDASLMVLGADGKTLTKDNAFCIWYKNEEGYGIKHSGDLRAGGTEEIVVDKETLDPRVQKLVFVASSHEEVTPKTIGLAGSASVFVINAATSEALYEFPLEGHSTSTCVELLEVDCSNQELELKSICNDLGSHAMGLKGAVQKYV